MINLKLIFNFVVFIYLFNLFLTIRAQKEYNGSCKKPHLDILISPLRDLDFKHRLIVVWNIENLLPDSWIILRKLNNEISKFSLSETFGHIDTNEIYQPLRNYTSFNKQSLDYCVELVQGEVGSIIIATSCMETNPNWMSENSKVISNMRIGQMFIPGTHDSGSYPNSTTKESRINKYVITQDERILNQLIFGIRSLDMRIGYYSVRKNDPKYLYVNHGIRSVQPLHKIVADIKTFLENTKEIVIVDFHGFPYGFNLKLPNVKPHEVLINYLIQELDHFIAPPSLTWDATLQDFWNLNKTLILSYNDKKMLNKYSHILWPNVYHKWGDAQTITRLHSFMTEVFYNPPRRAWSAQVQLTPTLTTIFTDQMKGLRTMADSVNKEVEKWFQNEWGHGCNIVACDFFRSTAIVKTSIAWNLRRAKQSMCDL